MTGIAYLCAPCICLQNIFYSMELEIKIISHPEFELKFWVYFGNERNETLLVKMNAHFINTSEKKSLKILPII